MLRRRGIRAVPRPMRLYPDNTTRRAWWATRTTSRTDAANRLLSGGTRQQVHEHGRRHLHHGRFVIGDEDDRIMWSLQRVALRRGLPPMVPAGVLADGWRGGSQAGCIGC